MYTIQQGNPLARFSEISVGEELIGRADPGKCDRIPNVRGS